MVTGADILVDAVLDAFDPFAARQQPGDPGFDAALPLELALTLGDDHLQPASGG